MVKLKTTAFISMVQSSTSFVLKSREY